MREASSPLALPSAEWSARLAELHRLATRAAPDQETAEEVAAEAAVRMVRWFGSIRDFLPWAATVVRRLTWDIVRRQRAQVVAAPAVLANLPAREEIGVELRVLVEESLARIPRQHAEILRLHREGLTHREIADQLGFTLCEIGPRLARAQRAARHALGPPESPSMVPSIKLDQGRSIER